MEGDNAIMQIMQPVRVIDVMLELDIINDNIPLNTSYIINGEPVKCLRRYINDVIINYTKDITIESNIIKLKSVYEELTGKKVDIKYQKKNPVQELYILLDELIEKIPMGIELEFMGNNIVCFNTIIKEVKIGFKISPRDTYWHSCIIDIYRILDLNGVKGFYGKY